jgi:hypothetical protein
MLRPSPTRRCTQRSEVLGNFQLAVAAIYGVIMILAISLLIGFGVSAFIMAAALVLFAAVFDERSVN